MTELASRLDQTALQVAENLATTHHRVVFAESCTGGLVVATLAGIPGISSHLCGSAVTYRGQTKIDWLNVDRDAVEKDSAVNERVATEMAAQVLAKTSESTLAASITGHLGPGAPSDLDGVVFVGLAQRDRPTQVSRHTLTTLSRKDRQREAAIVVLNTLLQALNAS